MNLATLPPQAAHSLPPWGEGGGEGKDAQTRRTLHRAKTVSAHTLRQSSTMRRCASRPSPQPSPLRGEGARAFTLVEVLAALLLIAIVLPVVMQGLSLATNAAGSAKRRTEAAGLAESKLNELVATGSWQTGNLSGDFAPDWPEYRWEANLKTYDSDSSGQSVQELDLRVIWTQRSRDESVALSTLTYAKGASLGE
ncbi:hypothetical protein BH10PLA1_BH10PLA1_19490 [soil metagenome]